MMTDPHAVQANSQRSKARSERCCLSGAIPGHWVKAPSPPHEEWNTMSDKHELSTLYNDGGKGIVGRCNGKWGRWGMGNYRAYGALGNRAALCCQDGNDR